MTKEFVITSSKLKSIATHYFTDFLYKKNILNYLDYLSHKEWQFLQRAVSDQETIDILGDKLYFQQYFCGTRIPLPRLIAYNVRETFVVKQETGWAIKELAITRPDSMCEIVRAILDLSANGTVFVKSTKGSGGKGVRRISAPADELSREMLGTLKRDVLNGSFVFQEGLAQHEDMLRLNPSSINTVRIDTFKASGKKPKVISAFLRVGRYGSCVDNLVTSGGFLVAIDLEKGVLRSPGLSILIKGGKLATTHPDTSVSFEGFKIPYFEDVKELAIEAASWLPKALIGWDVAISDHGPVLIEGNTVYYDMSDSDIGYGGYRKHPVIKEVIAFIRDDLGKRMPKSLVDLH